MYVFRIPYSFLFVVHLCISNLTVAFFLLLAFLILTSLYLILEKVFAARNFLVILEEQFGAPKMPYRAISIWGAILDP